MTQHAEAFAVWAGAILSGGAVIGLIWQHVVQPLRRLHGSITSTLNLVNTELRPNGGSSLRDAVNRIDLRLVLNESRARAMVEHMRIIAWESNTSGAWTYVSREFTQMFEMQHDSACGHGWQAIIDSTDQQRVYSHWLACVTQERDFSIDFITRGGTMQVHAEAYPIRDGKNYKGHVGVMYVTAREMLSGSASRIGPVGGQQVG